MKHRERAPQPQLRLLECWLPLAQHINQQHGWGCGAAELETLILVAAADLARAGSAPEAHGILWYHHLLGHTRRP